MRGTPIWTTWCLVMFVFANWIADETHGAVRGALLVLAFASLVLHGRSLDQWDRDHKEMQRMMKVIEQLGGVE